MADEEKIVCKNCKHKIYLFEGTWYHLIGYTMRTAEPNIEARLNRLCGYKEEIICKTCEHLDYSDVCPCGKPEPKTNKEVVKHD